MLHFYYIFLTFMCLSYSNIKIGFLLDRFGLKTIETMVGGSILVSQ